MAEAFLRDEAARHGLDMEVASTGTHAWDGHPATHQARATMRELGVANAEFRARELTRELLDWADLVVALAREHVKWIVRLHPPAAPKTATLRSLAGEADGDVEDPYGSRDEAYRRVAADIRPLITALVERI